ncbi:hypothetical protein BDV12DRAFT_188602 [Aspergillus spectabilis]
MIIPIMASMLLTALPYLCVGQFTRNADICCAALGASSISNRIAFPGTSAYEESLHSYFGVNAQLHPTCIVQPLSVQDVSVALQTLTTSGPGPCFFAVRSGGHTTTVGASNIEPGVTIDLSLMRRIAYNPSTRTVAIQPGARWRSVYETLLGHNVMVPGGRTASVGVGGYLLGGGNSYFAARVGISCDSIQSYEIVLASGEIRNVNRHSSADLFKALKGGSSNFGIVTKFVMAVFPAEDIWGGAIIHNSSLAPQYISAAQRFADNIPKDPYASWVAIFSYNSTTDQTLIVSSLAYTRRLAWPSAFDDFYQIPNITDTLRFSRILDITTENEFPQGYRNALQTGTYLNREEVLRQAIDSFTSQVHAAKSSARGPDFTMSTIVQPWVPLFWKDSEARGGNVLGLERFNESMLNVAYDYSWDDEADDDLFYGLAKSARIGLDEYTQSTGLYNEYVYLNYAGDTQKPLRGYGADNMAFLHQVQRKYDPNGVFQRLMPGGFKIWRV